MPDTETWLDGERLACGVPVDDLFEQVVDGRPPRDAEHQRHCPHCRAALAELTDTWAPVRAVAAAPVTAPPDLLAEVMRRIRELARHPWHAVVAMDGGDVRVAGRVVGAVARLAAQSVPQVTLAFGRGRSRDGGPLSRDRRNPEPAVGVAGTHVVVDVDIAVDYGAPLPAVAQQVRDQIRRDLRRLTGLTTAEVNVTVVDVRLP